MSNYNSNKGNNKHPETCVKPDDLEKMKIDCDSPIAWKNGDMTQGASNTGESYGCHLYKQYEDCKSKSRALSNVASVVNNSKGSTNAVNVYNKTGGKAKKGGMMLIKQALLPAALTASAISYKKKKSQKGGLLALGANNAAVATLVAARMSMKKKKGGKKTRGKKVKGRKPKRKGTRKK